MRVWGLGADNLSRTLRKSEFDRWDHGLLVSVDVDTGDL